MHSQANTIFGAKEFRSDLD